ncbi:MAG TPA: hypothetical protein VK324_00695 [Tepidisphaeraceae bacterium]|nr:hypothetical protein [Tepidisphaeraceae bacterium]
MSDTLPKPRLLRRLRYTPLRDVVRGRITGRLDVAAQIAGATDVPPATKAVVLEVVRRTRLWPAERMDVADELIAHFADGAASGEPIDALVAAFGDPRAAARLIRRAKIRNRPLAWHALRFVGRVLAVLLAVYAVMAVRFYLGRPTLTVNYVEQLNAAARAVPEDQRAWPLYRQAIQDLVPADGSGLRPVDDLLFADPGSEEWPRLVAYLDERAGAVAMLRQAAAQPAYGTVLGHGSASAASALLAAWPSADNRPVPAAPMDAVMRSMLSIQLAGLQDVRFAANVLMADARVAREAGDGQRLLADIDALLGAAEQLRRDRRLLVIDLTGIGVRAMAQTEIEATLVARPALLGDADLVRLAHALARLHGAADLINFSGERATFYDALQRLYTDDGDGDGRITPEGMRYLDARDAIARQSTKAAIVAPGQRTRNTSDDAAAGALIAGPNAAVTVASRREVRAAFDAMVDEWAARLRAPLRDVVPFHPDGRFDTWDESPVDRARYLPVLVMGWRYLGNAQVLAERVLGHAEGLQVAIALEFFRRRHGRYPSTLDALVPTFLPAVPADRIDGRPLRYRLTDRGPLVYSVGMDRDDDGGRVGRHRNGLESPWSAAHWAGPPHQDMVDGDWPVYPLGTLTPTPPNPATTTAPRSSR